KRKHPIDYQYDCSVLSRFPEKDYSESERFPDNISMFCFPNGLSFRYEPDSPPEATCHSFVTIATEGLGDKSYGVCLTIYEKIQEPLLSQLEELIDEWRQECIANTDMEYLQYLQSQLAMNQEQILKARSNQFPDMDPSDIQELITDAEEKVFLFRELMKAMEKVMPIDLEHVYVPRCIGLISRWPFYDVFGDWLKETVRIVKGKNATEEEGEEGSQISRTAYNIPLERLLVNFLYEIPLPPPGRVEVKITIGRHNLFCSRPSVNSIQVLQNVSTLTSITRIQKHG
ncbi:uDENN domain-containing protein, partial [Obelidium mucronatum]